MPRPRPPERPLRVAADPADAGALIGIERSITVAMAADVLSVDASTIRKLLKSGDLRGHRVGTRRGGVRVFVASIAAYQQANIIGVEAPKPRAPATRRPAATAAHREALATLVALGCIMPQRGGSTG